MSGLDELSDESDDGESRSRESLIGESGSGERARGTPLAGLVIETRRLVLRAPSAADAAVIVELADNANVARNLVGMPHPYRLRDAQTWIAEAAPHGGQKHLICLKGVDAAPRPIGAATLDFRRGATLPTIGCWLGQPFWGRGFATEASHAVIDCAFLHQGHARVSFTCRVTNEAGRRVIEKCGFQWTGQDLVPVLSVGTPVPVDRFQLERSTWESLRRWEPLRFASGAPDRNPSAALALDGMRPVEV
jgi:RimJ/RimL family protein N-acetyltransferase